MHMTAVQPSSKSTASANPTARVGRLRSVCEISAEMRRVYRQTRRGELNSLEATRLVNILNLILGAVRVGELESRLQQLEEHYERQLHRPLSPAG